MFLYVLKCVSASGELSTAETLDYTAFQGIKNTVYNIEKVFDG